MRWKEEPAVLHSNHTWLTFSVDAVWKRLTPITFHVYRIFNHEDVQVWESGANLEISKL